MDAKGALAAALDVAALEFAPRAVDEQLDAMAMNTEDALREYLKLFVRVPLVGRLGPLARTFDFVADAAPGVKEILGVGKLAYEVRERSLRPRRRRRRGERSHRRPGRRPAGDRRADPGRHGPRTDPMDARHPRGPGANRRRRRHDARGDAGRRDDRTARSSRRRDAGVARCDRRQSRASGAVRPQGVRRRRAASVGADQLLVDAAGPGVRDVVLAAQLTEARRVVGGRHLERLRAAVPPGLPILYVPELFTRATGRRVVALVAEALGDELDVA